MRDSGEITFEYESYAITEILLPNGQELLGDTGGLYAIGNSKPGSPDDADNHTSAGQQDGKLKGANGAPFSMRFQRVDGRTIQVELEVGPLPVPYHSLSFPLDCDKELFDTFRFDGPGYSVGCANRWERRSGAEARYDSIPLWCHIPDVGGVGMAIAGRSAGWAEIQGPHATIRRAFETHVHVDMTCVYHPYTKNLEPSFTRPVHPGSVLPAGTIIRHVERLTVTPAGSAPIEPPAPEPPAPGGESPYDRWLDTGETTPAQVRDIYRELLGREPDPGGLAYYVGKHWTPAHVWFDIRSSKEYARVHPGQPAPEPPPSLGGPPTDPGTPSPEPPPRPGPVAPPKPGPLAPDEPWRPPYDGR